MGSFMRVYNTAYRTQCAQCHREHNESHGGQPFLKRCSPRQGIEWPPLGLARKCYHLTSLCGRIAPYLAARAGSVARQTGGMSMRTRVSVVLVMVMLVMVVAWWSP